jgi:hypothetical protein
MLRRTARLVWPFLLLAALAFPATAAAVWSAPVTLSAAGQDGKYPQVAADSTGNAVFAWERSDGSTACNNFPCERIQGRARSAAGTLSAVQNISAAGKYAINPQVAVDPNGNAVFIWAQQVTPTEVVIVARRRSAGGVLGSPKSISAKIGPKGGYPYGGEAVVGVDSNGNAVIVWERTDTAGDVRIQTRSLSASGTLSSIQNLSPSGKDGSRPHVAVDPNGNAVFVWNSSDKTTNCSGGGPCSSAQARTRTAAGVLSAIQTLSSGGGQAAQDAVFQLPQVGVDAGGNAIFVWRRYDQTTNCGGGPCPRIWTRARSAAGVLSATQTVSGPIGANLVPPQVATDQSGDAVFVWQATDSMGFPRINGRARSAAGGLSTIQVLSDANATAPQVGVDAGGNALFVWQQGASGCQTFPCYRIQTRARSAQGTLSSVEFLSAAGQTANEPHVAVAANGMAAADWRRFDGTKYRIQGAGGP